MVTDEIEAVAFGRVAKKPNIFPGIFVVIIDDDLFFFYKKDQPIFIHFFVYIAHYISGRFISSK